MNLWIRPVVAGLAAAATVLAGWVAPAVAAPDAAPGTPTRPQVHNAVSDAFSDTFADPAVIQAKDGWWYAYSTADPLRAGEPSGTMHIARTRDWRDWDYLGTVFDQTNRPSWAASTAGLWAPDVRYVDGRYVLYYTVTDTTLNPGGDDSAIGMATAPSPTGPWTPAAAPVVGPRAAPGGGWWWTFDPSMVTAVDGRHYLYYGSYFGGLWVSELDATATRAIGTPRQVAIDNRYEGSYVTRHDGWYYLQASAANCCAGPTTGYSVFAGRSRSPLGPFVDADGIGLLEPAVGGTTMLTQNGNRFVGNGHHAVITDATGRDFVVYHGIDENRPWLNAPFGINRRPMLIDRLDWIDGWPRTRAGAGPSDTEQPGPVIASSLGIVADDPAAGGFTGLRSVDDPQAGRSARPDPQARTVRPVTAGDVRISLDVRTDADLTVALGRRTGVSVTIDAAAGTLAVTTTGAAGDRTSSTALPASAGWQRLTVDLIDGRLVVGVSESGLGDPSAEVVLERVRPDSAPLRLTGADALVDNVTVNPIAERVRTAAPVPQPGRVLLDEQFTDPRLPGWTWLRRDPRVQVSGGALRWPVSGDDLVGGGNTAALLLRAVPADVDWIAETRLDLDLGTDIRNYQQAGMIIHAGDDDFARLGSVAIWNTRQTEFGRELVATADGRTSYGGALIGTPAPRVWLRIAHHRAANGEHVYRAATNRDGRSWTWGAAWTFPAGSQPRLGLYAHGGATPANTAVFDNLRISRTAWPRDPGSGIG